VGVAGWKARDTADKNVCATFPQGVRQHRLTDYKQTQTT